MKAYRVKDNSPYTITKAGSIGIYFSNEEVEAAGGLGYHNEEDEIADERKLLYFIYYSHPNQNTLPSHYLIEDKYVEEYEGDVVHLLNAVFQVHGGNDYMQPWVMNKLIENIGGNPPKLYEDIEL